MTFVEFLNFISQNFFYFFGFLIVLVIINIFLYKFITRLWNRLLSAITIWKKGYPPEYCDVSGEIFD